MQPIKPRTPRRTPYLDVKCTRFFYVHNTTPRTYRFTVPPKDEAIMVKCLACGHKCHDGDSDPHSADQKHGTNGFMADPKAEQKWWSVLLQDTRVTTGTRTHILLIRNTEPTALWPIQRRSNNGEVSCLRTQESRPGLESTLCWSKTPESLSLVFLSTWPRHARWLWDGRTDYWDKSSLLWRVGAFLFLGRRWLDIQLILGLWLWINAETWNLKRNKKITGNDRDEYYNFHTAFILDLWTSR